MMKTFQVAITDSRQFKRLIYVEAANISDLKFRLDLSLETFGCHLDSVDEADVLRPLRSTAMIARDFASAAHGSQQYNGRPYIQHCDEVVAVLREFGFCGWQMIAAGYLHDVAEDTSVGVSEIREAFGEDISGLVWRVTAEPGKNRKERNAKTYPKIAPDVNAVILKLADRIANVRAGIADANSKVEMYRKEYPAFRTALYKDEGLCPMEMWKELESADGWVPEDMSNREKLYVGASPDAWLPDGWSPLVSYIHQDGGLAVVQTGDVWRLLHRGLDTGNAFRTALEAIEFADDARMHGG